MKIALKIASLALALALTYVLMRPASAPAHATNPLGGLLRDTIAAPPIEGRVEQRLPAGSYTYLALRTERDAVLWAVTLGKGEPPGARVKVRSMGHRPDFHSRRLNRTFPDLVFGMVSRVD